MGPILALQRLAGNAAVAGLLGPKAAATGGPGPQPSGPEAAEQPVPVPPDLPAPIERSTGDTTASTPAAAQVVATAEQQAQLVEATAAEATARLEAGAAAQHSQLDGAFGAQLAAVDAGGRAVITRARADVTGHSAAIAAADGNARTTIRAAATAANQQTRQQVDELAVGADAHAAAQADRARTGATERLGAMGAPGKSADPDVAAGQQRIADQVKGKAGTELSGSGTRTAQQVRARAVDRQRQLYGPAATQAGGQIQASAQQADQAIAKGKDTAITALHRTASVTEQSAGQAQRAVTSALRARSTAAAADVTSWKALGTSRIRETAGKLAAGIRSQGQQLAREVGRLRGRAADTAATAAADALGQAGSQTSAAVTDTAAALVDGSAELVTGHAQAVAAAGPQIAGGFDSVTQAASRAASKGATAFTALTAQTGAAAAAELQQAPGRAAQGLAGEHARGMAEVSGGVDQAAQAETSWAANASGRAQGGAAEYANQAQQLGQQASEQAPVQRLFGELINSMRSWLRDKLGDVLGGIVSGIILSIPAIAIAVGLILAGPVGWGVLAVLVVVGAGLGIYGRFSEYAADHGGQGPGWGEGIALVGLGIADLTGIPYIVEAAVGQRAFAPKPMSEFERWERGTQGVINLALIVVGGAKKLLGRTGGEPVRVPAPGEGGPAPVPGERGPAPVPGERGPGEPIPADRPPGETPSARPPMTRARMIEIIKQIDSGEPVEFTAEVAEALRMNADLATAKWIKLNETGRVPWDSIRNQLNLTRWRFLPRAPEAAQVLRNALMRLPDVPERAEMLGLLDRWVGSGSGGGTPVPVPVPAPRHDEDE